MSYQVLARKWRPNRFSELVGQEHVVKAISNALDNNRLHHAYLFTGTRGVGKTTIARIFSKSLNCETGMSADPCGQCSTCKEIEQGSYVDLLEIDAASRTKVEDTRELLDNVQYKPTRGEFKVYLIDEVHMLSKHSFNALLKTLEEPPPHVKFLLATTDPQKLPITILSRCLQFNLKALSREQISHQLEHILTLENLPFENQGLLQIARAAQGSMRDALSLTDQAIAQGNGNVSNEVVTDMLGLMDKNQILKLVHAVFSGEANQVMEQVESISFQAPDYSQVLNEIMSLLHQVALTQFVPEACKLETVSARAIFQLSKMLPAEQVQLSYQIALQGKKDLPFAANGRMGLEMTLIRMLAFNPETIDLTIDATNDLTTLTPKPSSTIAERGSGQIATPAMHKEESVNTSSSTIEPSSLTTRDESNVPMEPMEPMGAGQNDHSSEGMSTRVEPAVENDAEQQLFDQQQDILVQSEMLRPSEQTAELSQHSVPSEIDDGTESTAASGADNEYNVESKADKLSSTESLIALKSKLSQPSVDDGGETSTVKKSESSLQFAAKPSVDLAEPANTASLATDKSEENIESTPEILASNSDDTSCNKDAIGQASENSATAVETDAQDQTDDIPPWAKTKHSEEKEVQPLFDPNSHIEDKTEAPVDLDVPAFLESGQKVVASEQLDSWAQLIEQMQVAALTKQLALHSTFEKNDNLVTLKLSDSKPHLNTESARAQLEGALCECLQQDIKLEVEIGQPVNTPFGLQQEINRKRLEYATEVVNSDENILRMQNTFSAQVIEGSVKAR